MENYRIIRPAEAAQILGISTVTLWRYSKEKKDFPRKVRLSQRCIGYRSDEIYEYIKKMRL
jgi:predicted DNA-binding transcriptional regulator AlpA